MNQQTRRDFLTDVGKGAVIASVGSGLAAELGFSAAFADDGPERLTFGPLEPLVSLMQETPAGRLLPQVVQRLSQGVQLRDVVAAAALANARTFGGEDYVGFHTMMAISPCYHMAGELPEARRALPILKVIHRNATRIHERSNPRAEVLRPVQSAELLSGRPGGEILREQVRQPNVNAAERTFAALARGNNARAALNDLLWEIEDGADVHRVVLPYRCWDLLGIIGRDQAHTLLRQSVRFCVKSEDPRYVQYMSGLRTLVPRLLDQHRLLSKPFGRRPAEDAWVERMSQTFFRSTPDQAADAAAAALAEGIAPDAIGEAISLAANQLVLRDNGRTRADAPNKPVGSVHGDSIGVHACDSVNAWRNLARIGDARNKAVCLILGAYQVARDRGARGQFLEWQPYPREEARTQMQNTREPEALLRAAEDAIRNRDQARAAAAIYRYGELGHPPRAAFDLLLRYAISEDGALHAEKFYRTTCEEYASIRAPFRWRHVVALARVTASAHGYPAPGHADACRLLNV